MCTGTLRANREGLAQHDVIAHEGGAAGGGGDQRVPAVTQQQPVGRTRQIGCGGCILVSGWGGWGLQEHRAAKARPRPRRRRRPGAYTRPLPSST